jgi:AcrR family transcriptional regulator
LQTASIRSPALPIVNGRSGHCGFGRHDSANGGHVAGFAVAYLVPEGLAIRHRIRLGEADMTGGKSDVWIAAGFSEIARSGVEGVRVEVLAKSLGVTKGGFYRRFKDRAALLAGMLQSWSEGRIAAIEQHAALDGTSARERLKSLIHLYSERMNTEGMAIELAIRQWARSDADAADAVGRVDAARLKNVGRLYRAAGLEADDADAQAFLFYCFVFGQGLVFLDRAQRRRAQLIAKSAEKLLDEKTIRSSPTGA